MLLTHPKPTGTAKNLLCYSYSATEHLNSCGVITDPAAEPFACCQSQKITHNIYKITQYIQNNTYKIIYTQYIQSNSQTSCWVMHNVTQPLGVRMKRDFKMLRKLGFLLGSTQTQRLKHGLNIDSQIHAARQLAGVLGTR